MKKTLVFMILSVGLGVLGWWLLSREPIWRVTGGQTVEDMTTYQEYAGTQPGLMVRFEYPQAWPLHEEQGKREFYRAIRIAGPRNPNDTYTTYLSVRASPLKSFGGKYERLADAITQYVDHLLEGSRIIAQQQATVADSTGTDVLVTYTMPALHHKGLKAEAVPVTARTVFFEKAPYLYEVTYSADSREYEQHAQAFEHLLTTFRFQ